MMPDIAHRPLEPQPVEAPLGASSPEVACQFDCIVSQLNAICTGNRSPSVGAVQQDGSSSGRIQEDDHTKNAPSNLATKNAAEYEGSGLLLWPQPEQQHHHRTSPFSSPDPHHTAHQASQDQQQQHWQQQQQQQQQHSIGTNHSSPQLELSSLSGSAPVTMPSLASVATSHMGHLVPPGRIGSPGMGGGTPFNRSMSALDLGPSALVGERVRAGRGKAATSYDFEGKVHGGMYRSASCKSNCLMEDWMGFDVASSCVPSGAPLVSMRSASEASPSMRVHRISLPQPQNSVGLQHSLSSPRGGAPSFPLLNASHVVGGPPPFLLASHHSRACSSSAESNSVAAGSGNVGTVGSAVLGEQEERHWGGRSRSRSSSGVGDVVMRNMPQAGGEGGVQEVVKGVTEEDEEEQRVQGLLLGAGISSCCNSSSSSRAHSHDAPHSGSSLLMAVAEEEAEGGGGGTSELQGRPAQTLPSVQQQDSQQQVSHLLYPTGLPSAASPSPAQKFVRNSSCGRSRHSLGGSGPLGEAMSSSWGFGGGAINSYGSCGSGLSLLEFADESSSRSLGGSVNRSTPQSPSCSMLFKVRPSGSGDGCTHSVATRNYSSSMQAGLCSLAQAVAMDGPSSVPSMRQGEAMGRGSLNRPRKVQLATSVSMPHTVCGSATSPHSPCRPSPSMPTSYSSLLEYAEASSRSQSRKLSTCDSWHLGCNLNSCDEQQL